MIKLIGGKYFRSLFYIIFSFLLGCMITINLTPIEKTCQIDNSDREYNIMQNSKFKNPELIILILSAPNNLGKRETIRETWLTLYNNENIYDHEFKLKHYFVIGSLGLNADQLLHLSSEQSKYNDILILPVLDTYKTLTEKIKRSFVWLNDQYDYGLSFKYVLKCDDDSYVNLSALTQELIAIENLYVTSDLKYPFKPKSKPNSYISTNVQVNDKDIKGNFLSLYWGYFSGTAKIKSKGKWTENDWIASDRYIPYALGGGYVLSKNLVTYIGKNADDLRSFNSEDVSVGFWLSPVNNILRVHDIRFDTEWKSRGCRNTHLVIHNIAQQGMRNIYKNYIQRKTLCSEEVEKRNYYIYNWSVLPSQCCKSLDENIKPFNK